MWVLQLVLPDVEDAPAELTEFTVHAAVARLVVGELFQPKGAAGGRESGVPRATMPETAVNEDG